MGRIISIYKDQDGVMRLKMYRYYLEVKIDGQLFLFLAQGKPRSCYMVEKKNKYLNSNFAGGDVCDT